MKTIFAGTTDFGLPTLEMLRLNFGLSLVITRPDKPAGRDRKLTPTPVRVWAEKHGIPVIQPQKISEAAEVIRNAQADVMVVAAYGQIIPKDILALPRLGSINLHSSLLPKYRGASPIQAALLNDDKRTGVTVMLMDELLDHGPILMQFPVDIEDKDNYTTLHAKLAQAGAKALSLALPKYAAGELKPQPQNHPQATVVKTIRRDQARIDWTRPAREIAQLIKALNPEPGTWTTLEDKSVKIMEVTEVRNSRIELPGQVYAEMTSRDCLVKCGDHSLKLLELQVEGRKPTTGRDFLNGLRNLETKIFR